MVTMHRYLPFFVIFSALATAGAPAAAQNCKVVYEEFATLRSSPTGSYNIWDSVNGEIDRDEAYKSGVILESGDVLVAGETEQPHSDKPRLLISQLGRNGRVLWEVFHDIPGLRSVEKILLHDKGFLVLGNLDTEKDGGQIWLGMVDKLGALLDQKIIKDKKGDLTGYDMVRAHDGKSYLLAATMAVHNLEQPTSSVLYRVDSAGKVIGDNGFVTGSENRIEGLDYLDDGTVVATGFSYGADMRKQGWIMKLNKDFGIDWQRVYPRGAGAALSAGRSMLAHTIAVVGTAAPAVKGGLRAGWVMLVSADNGEVGWQRYYLSDQHYAGRDLSVSKDGLISVMLDGDAASETENPAHIRLVTLNPRGAIFAADQYMNSESVDAYQMLIGNSGERVLVGRSQVAYQIENSAATSPEEKIRTERSKEGWVAAVPSVDPYDDPCRQSINFLP